LKFNVCNTSGKCTSSEAYIKVLPLAKNDTITVGFNGQTTTKVLTNDLGNLNPSTLVLNSQPLNGTAILNGDGTITYIPNLGYSGNDSYSYSICDNTLPSSLCSNPAWVIISVSEALPKANAGSNQILYIPAMAGLDGSLSTGNKLNYKWSKVSGPVGDSIFNDQSVKTWVHFSKPGIYQYSLLVIDMYGNTDTSQTTINVLPAIVKPKAILVGDTLWEIPNTQKLLLSAYRSIFDKNIGASFIWQQVSGPNNDTLLSPTDSLLDIGFALPGLYKYKLIVSQNDNTSDSTFISIKVVLGFNNPGNMPSIKIFPSPVSTLGVLHYYSTINGPITISLYDLLGRQYFESQHNKDANEFITNINFGSLAKDYYLVTVKQNKNIISYKIFKK